MTVSYVRMIGVPVLALAAALLAAPLAAADPLSQTGEGASAADVIADLQDQGYDVQINWDRGVSSVPLSECWSTGVNNPNRTGGPPEGFTTVYVDVACPSDDHDSGFVFGGGPVGFAVG
jgi:hypothetical protein